MDNKVEPTRPFYLRNHDQKDWSEPLAKTEVHGGQFKEGELIELLNNSVKRKSFVVIRGIKT